MSEIHSPGAEVFYADYAYHFKPYQAKKNRLNLYYIRLQMEGHCKATVNGETMLIYSGGLSLYQPGDTVQIGFEREPEAIPENRLISGNYHISCRGDWLTQWWRQSDKPKTINILLRESILSIFKEIVLEQRNLKQSRSEVTDYLLRTLCLLIDREIGEHSGRQNGQAYLAHRMKYYIMEYAEKTLRLEDVARYVGLSVSRAVHLFKTVFNQTIIQYAQEVRLSLACNRIKFTRMSLLKIAETSGFGSYTYFHRVFRAKYGISPKQYRDR